MSPRELIEEIASEKRRRLEGGGDDFRGSLKRLVSIWSDPSHALIELLQNADDAEATEVMYTLLPEGIVFRHNGNPFKEDEIQAICSIDKSTKDAETHTGFMGIGFKAVFKLSDSPIVICKPYRFGFLPDGFDADDWGWILVPRWIDELPPQVGPVNERETVFWLPYKKDLTEPVRKQVANSLTERFDGLCLLFLRHVQEIRIEHSETKRLLLRKNNTVIEERDGKIEIHRYKVVSKCFEVPPEVKEEYRVQESGRGKAIVRQVSLAFALDKDGNLKSLSDTLLYAFLPTDYRTGLRFVVQGDFILDTQRSRVDESLQWNRWLWRCVGEILKDAVIDFKSDERLRYQFYQVLPTKEDFRRDDLSIVRAEMAEPFWNYCRQEPIVLTASDLWVKPTEAILATPEVQRLLDPAKLKQLTGREHYVHPQVKAGRTFLKDMGVIELQEQQILEALKDVDWVKGHSVDWFCQLYEFLWDRLYGDRDKRWNDWWQRMEEAKKLPIVRTCDGDVRLPDNVLFPPEQEEDAELVKGIPGIAFVDPKVVTEHGRDLLKKLGVREFSAESIVKTILTNFANGEWENWTPEELERCKDFIKAWLKQQDWQVDSALRERLGAVRVRTEAGTWERADECYFPTDDLKSLLPDKPFVVLQSEDDDQSSFFEVLGIASLPRVKTISKVKGWETPNPQLPHWYEYLSWVKKHADLASGHLYAGLQSVHYLDNWWNIVENLNKERSHILLKFLIKHWEKYSKFMESTCLREGPRGGNRPSKDVPSYFRWCLLNSEWLPTTKGLKKPSPEIFVPTRSIKKIAGNLVCYVEVPEGWNEEDFVKQGQGLFQFLGLKATLDIEALIYLLKVAQNHEPNEQLKSYLSQVYRELGRRLLEDRAKVNLSKVALLTTRDEFRLAETLFWNDDPELGKEFEPSERIAFAWVPEKDVERRYLEQVFEAARVRRLSEHLIRHAVEPIIYCNLDSEWTQKLRGRANYLYSTLQHYGAKKSDLAQKLDQVEVWTVADLQVLLHLDDIDERIANVVAFYDLDGNRLLLTEDATPFDVATELARNFRLDFDHVDGIEVILQAKSEKEIERRFKQKGISVLSLPGDEVQASEESPTDGGRTEHVQTVPPSVAVPQQQEYKEPPTESFASSTERTKGSQREPVTTSPIIQWRHPSKHVERPPLSYEERMRREAENLQRVMAFEERQGRKPKDVSCYYLGYDIESTDEHNGKIRYIEVKSSSYVILTPNEKECAKQKGEDYYLYVVNDEMLYIIQDPANSCRLEGIEILETYWKVLDWTEKAERYPKPVG